MFWNVKAFLFLALSDLPAYGLSDFLT